MHKQKNSQNIALIGFSATGKSTVAKKVAEHLNWIFLDTDEEIIKLTGKTIPEIFKQNGEDEFRRLERQVIKQAFFAENVVIATGGGAVIDPENRRALLEGSTIICLESDIETIYKRLVQHSLYSPNPVIRPLLAGNNPLENIKNLKLARHKYYSIAERTILTDNLSVEEVVQEVVKGWEYANRHRINKKQLMENELACMVNTTDRNYPIYVGWGLMAELGGKMNRMGLSGTATIISDENVFSVHGSHCIESLEKAGFKVNHFLVPPGESSKNIDQVVKIYDFLIENHIERSDVIIALGGGMIGDMAGFVAATYLRGIPLVQVPTSLLGMVDASIGGKVAIDHPQGKNLIGAFYQPYIVLSDIQTLTSLPRRELISGWAEVIKHGLILDKEFFELLEINTEHLINLTPDITSKVIARSVCIKADVVMKDEKEAGKRIILNYGHTVAHGLESASDYTLFLHGEAVSIGMMAAAMLSQRLGFLSANIVERQQTLLNKFHLPVDCSGVNLEDIYSAMQLDKKVRNQSIQWILLEDIGKATIHSNVSKQDILSVLNEIVKP